MRTQKIKYLSYLSFEESRKFIRSLNFSCFGDWERYRKSGQKPENIPDYPPILCFVMRRYISRHNT